jgi:enterochelin esterase family protein
MSSGTINDGHLDARRMRDIMQVRGHTLTYQEVPEGHSWGNWRALIDEVLMALTPGGASPADAPPSSSGRLWIEMRPNPTGGDVEVQFAVPTAGTVDLSCFDLQGRLVSQIVSDTVAAGRHTRRVLFSDAGHYVCRLTSGSAHVARTVTVSR